MKKSFSLILFVCFTSFNCKKGTDSLNITLHDKPLSTIQSYIVGKWDLKYEQGGYTAGTYPQTNFFWTFTSDNRIKELYHDTITVDTTITWVREKGLFIGTNDSTYLMKFFDKENVPWNYVVDGIFNDTLVIHDNAYDGFYYHFTKVK